MTAVDEICQYIFYREGDRSRRTWITRLGTGEVKLRDLLGPARDLPVLELWHLEGEQRLWREICSTLRTEAVSVQKLVLNDVSMTDQLVPHITESLVNVRCCLSQLSTC